MIERFSRLLPAVTDLLDLFFPVWCAACGRTLTGWRSPGLCPDCENRVQWHSLNVRSGAAAVIPELAGTAAAAQYRHTARDLIHDFKYRGNLRLARPLARQMALALLAAREGNTRFDWIAPVPMHPLRLRYRGYNQSILLAKGLANRFRLSLCPASALRRIRNTRAQALTAPEERAANIAGAFSASPEIFIGKSVLLVDDVMTTGSTVRECARVLTGAGATSVFVCTWAS